jgi:DNA-binding GntR family transcriptional regulator
VKIEIDQHAPEPSYQQLADQLRSLIRSGKLKPRDALPSITELVTETGLAIGTVRKGIAVLVDEGLAYTVPGRGTFVADSKMPRRP